VAQILDFLAHDSRASFGWGIQRADDVEKRGLPRSAGADKAGEFGLLEHEIDMVESDDRGFAHRKDLDQFIGFDQIRVIHIDLTFFQPLNTTMIWNPLPA
jgi:hypothetical protein